MQFYAAKAVGHNTWYEIITDGNGKFDFHVDGQFKYTITKNIFPNTFQFFGEIHDKADQMPGEPANKVTFSGTGYFTLPGHVFNNSNHLFTTDWGALYGVGNNGTTHTIWDKC